MRIFNRLVVVLLLAGLFVLGVYTVVYSFDLLGYRLAELSSPLGSLASGLESFVGRVENGDLPPAVVALLIGAALLGLVVLLLELKPRRPRRVRMEKGTYVTRGAIEAEVVRAAGQTPSVLDSSVRAKARRRIGARVKLKAHVRRGEDLKAVKSALRQNVQQRLARRGLPLGRLKVSLVESDPRKTRTRVQ